MDGHPIANHYPVASDVDPAERLASLFDAHYDRLYRLARRLVPTSDDALDLVQETFLRAARSPQSVPSRSRNDEEAWLVRVLINIRRDQWRKTQVRNLSVSVEDSIQTSHSASNPETAVVAKTAVWKALDRLAPRRRAVIVLHELDETPVPAIASLLGISAITVRWHLSAGRRDLARILRRNSGDTK
jgi:RNA polymerase sigma-70 factor (ECF subfamily)